MCVCVCVCVCERERERETERQTDRQTDRDRETDRQTDRDRETETELPELVLKTNKPYRLSRMQYRRLFRIEHLDAVTVSERHSSRELLAIPLLSYGGVETRTVN